MNNVIISNIKLYMATPLERLSFDKIILKYGEHSKHEMVANHGWDERTFDVVEKDYYKNLLREKVIKYYQKCVLTEETKLPCLEVVHIKPLKDCNFHEKKNKHNTLLIWVDLVRYFENYDFTIDPVTKRIIVCSDCVNCEWLADRIYDTIDISSKSDPFIQHHFDKFHRIHCDIVY
jgi:hypothetical protein